MTSVLSPRCPLHVSCARDGPRRTRCSAFARGASGSLNRARIARCHRALTFDPLPRRERGRRSDFKPGLGDELLSLMPTNLACYPYAMRQDAQHLPDSLAMPARCEKLKTTFDGTNPPIVGKHPKTTTGGMNCSFQLFSISQNRAPRTLDRLHIALFPSQFPTFATAIFSG